MQISPTDTNLHRYLELAMGQETTVAVSLDHSLTATDRNRDVTLVTLLYLRVSLGFRIRASLNKQRTRPHLQNDW